MKQTMSPRRGSVIFTTLFLLLCLALQPQTLRAADCPLESSSNYSVSIEGTNQMRIKFPAYDKEAYDCWIVEGEIKIQIVGTGSSETIFHCEMEQSISDSDYYPNITHWKGVDGKMILYRERNYGSVSVSGSSQTSALPCMSNSETAYANLLWTIPRKYRGQKVEVSWSMHHNGNMTEPNKYITITSSTFDISPAPAAQNPELMEPVISYNSGSPNQIFVPYMIAATNIKSIKAHYTEVYSGYTVNKTLDMKKESSGFIPFNAEQPVRDLYVECTYINNENDEETTSSSKQDVPVLHQPKSLTAHLQADGQVELTWMVLNTNWAEITPNDSWEIQRNVTGSSDPSNAGWTTVGHLSYDEFASEFSFTDATFLQAYTGNTVYYRLRRTVSSIWGWTMQSGYVMTSLPAMLRLPTLAEATVHRHNTWNTDQHGVDLSFHVGGPEKDAQGRLLLRTAEDWKTFIKRVQEANGSSNVDAVLCADITITEPVGNSSAAPYRGTFDGNGHTLTCNINWTQQDIGPFRFVGDATIKNLHTAGTITSSVKHQGGLIGSITRGGTVYITNCRSSVNLVSSVNDDSCVGGFVGTAMSINRLEFSNCLFDGGFDGPNNKKNGGFVGWASGYNAVNVMNCMFAPTYIKTGIDGCMTWVRTNTPSKINPFHCCYTTNYGEKGLEIDTERNYVIRSSQDWELLRQIVENYDGPAGTKYFDAVLYADITVESCIGTESKPYAGSFYGNGHTLNLKIDGGSNKYTAPFRYVTLSTSAYDLHVTGTIKGGDYTAGIFGTSVLSTNGNCADYYCRNVRVSAEITTSGNHVGGFIGFDATKEGNQYNPTPGVSMYECLFDGTLKSTSGSGERYGGAFVGWGIGRWDWQDGLYENGNYSGLNHTAINYRSDGTPWCEDWDTYTAHNWGEVRSGNNNFTDQQALLQKPGFRTSWHLVDGKAVPKFSFRAGTPLSEATPQQLQALLGDQWTVQGSSVVPQADISAEPLHATFIWDDRAKLVLHTDKKDKQSQTVYTDSHVLTKEERESGKLHMELATACLDHEFRFSVLQSESRLEPAIKQDVAVTKTDQGDLKIYKFDNNARLTAIKADTLQNSVSLAWETDGGTVDYYRITRYDKLHPEEVKTLETEYTQEAYIDRTVQPQHVYVYTIEGVTKCEGENVTRISTEGCCDPTGMVRGYVRLANGIGLPGVTVTATPKNRQQGNVGTCVTDSTGYFEIGGLRYQGQGTYDLTAEGLGTVQSVTFDELSNLQTNINFYEQTYYNFAGYVLYEGTSIPVSGVQFLRDGEPVIDASGKAVTTDNQGAFLVNIPAGPHTLQVVKEGHVFKDGGFYIDLDKQSPDHDWQKDISDIYLWDQTKVTLQGRVVGGNVEGLKPLGESLSRNNLCDSVTIVMQLEGDNTSWIVRDQLDATVTSRVFEVTHGQTDTTRVEAYRHRIVIHPDPKTGEYQLPLCPVKYKVTEIYGKNYPTLFQSGTFSETLDLSRYTEGETAAYSRIYHAQPTLDIWQFQGSQDRFYGIRQYISRDNSGARDTISLWRDGRYSLGYPVFMAGASVPMVLSAREEYYYNNDRLSQPDIVQLDGGVVRAANGLAGTDETEVIELDSVGQGTYVFTPQNTTFLLQGDMALRTLQFTLEYDGSFYDIQPLRGYIMAALPKPQGRRILAGTNIHLFDILRDPPGAASSAYIEKGSKMSYSYTADFSAMAGVKIDLGKGSGSDFFTGSWAGVGSGTTAGTLNSTSNTGKLSFDISSKYYQDWSYEYELETTEKISTSSNAKDVGMNSDVYIGVVDNVVVEDAIAVRMVSSAAMQRLMPGMGGTIYVEGHPLRVSGTAKVLARGWDAARKDSVYLVRDEVMSVSSKVNSTFVHSQEYLLSELIPSLVRTRNALLLDSTTTAAMAQATADAQKVPVYVSTVAPGSADFARDGYYRRYTPQGITDTWNDSISALNNQIQTWAGFIAANEKEKLEARELMQVYDVDGRAEVAYSETFTTTKGLGRYWKIPGLDVSGDFSGTKQTDQGRVTKQAEMDDDDEERVISVDFQAGGTLYTLEIAPQVGVDFNYKNGTDTTFTKQLGFTLACSRNSNLMVGVYKTSEISKDSISALAKAGRFNVFYKHVEDNLKDIYNGVQGSNASNFIQNGLTSVPRYCNFVYRTMGGATASPWEEERRTLFYNTGTILDQATMQINKLRIWAKEPTVSNVPYGEPARFTIYYTNESEMPARITPTMNLYSEDGMNAKGARILIDGAPLTGSGRDVWLEPGVVYEKQVEVYAAADYDYEDLGISIMDNDDVKHIETVNLSAHFVPAAGPVNISAPGDKWVVNTESAFDGERNLYYLPVHIDGFDVNFRNFDHIELQYKLSTQGDRDWVNVCSYYANTDEGRALMELASGEKQLMKNDGFIDVNFYGENDPIEQHYDLRAVCYCRHAGGYLTRPSNIISGIKDTRRPQLFGTPEPTNGILGPDDDIRLGFSEQIAYNYLSPINNFEVLGLTNQSSLSLATALQFGEESYVISMANRNLSAKDFSLELMLRPRLNGKAMSVFSHRVSEEEYINLGFSADGHLTADVSGITMQSSQTVSFADMTHVGYVFDVDAEQNTTAVTFYAGNKAVGEATFQGMYNGSAPLCFGEDYEGEMAEVRLWNKALTTAQMTQYSGHRLTGNELGLLDNYPMDEGRGDYAYDKGLGSADLYLSNTSWHVPEGISLKLDGTEGVSLNPQPFNRQDYEDYSLMFWFRSADKDATLLGNGEARDEAGGKDHFNIGFQDGTLFFRSGGQQVDARGLYNDGAWHHIAVTVNRSRNVGNLYVDQKLEQSFPVDTLGGIAGNGLCIGATVNTANATFSNCMKGNIDEVAIFEMALPENIVRLMSNQTPSGREMGLMAYLPFSNTEKQMDNSQRLMPSAVSIKRYKDNHGEVVEARRDTLFAQDIAARLADRQSYAPMAGSGALENIKYSYVADGIGLLISLDVPDYQIEKTNVYITVKEVADLQGNLMASPVTMDLYVYQNPIRWNAKRKEVDVRYGEQTTIDLAIQNLSGKARDFTIEGLPLWITASQTTGRLAPLDEQPLTLTISPYINIGDFEEVIYIVGENGITEPLPLNIHVRGDAPEWAVDDRLKAGNITMHMVARVMHNGEVAHDTEDILAAVGSGHRILGTAHVQQGATENDGLVYLTIYGDAATSGTPLAFEFFDASTGRILTKMPRHQTADGLVADTIRFQADTILGTATNPITLYAAGGEVQSVSLHKGWNWASTYVQPQQATVSELLNSIGSWEVGEAVELMTADGMAHLITYKAVYDPDTHAERYYWDNGDKTVEFDPTRMYRFFVKNDKNVYIAGENRSYENIRLHKGWNRIGYLAMANLPVATALADYTDAASDGDIIKSQSEFAVLNIDAQGNRTWKGTLAFLHNGEGYMLKRNADTECSFGYPFYISGSRYNQVKQQVHQAPLFRNTSGGSMNVIACTEGVELPEGCRLVAYDRSGQTCGVAQPDADGLFFLTVADTQDGSVGFYIEQDEEIIAAATLKIPYQADGVMGTLEEPTVISFERAEGLAGSGWYDISGRKLQGKPTRRGVYIHNGKKETIK